MIEGRADGEKQLVFSILKQAILDAKLCRLPKRLHKKIKLNRIEINKIRLRKTFLFSVANYHYYGKDKRFYSIALLAMLDKIFKYNERDPKRNITKCLDARRFINDKNPVFCAYMQMIDRDPKYVADKINHEILLFDYGRKNKLRIKGKVLTA